MLQEELKFAVNLFTSCMNAFYRKYLRNMTNMTLIQEDFRNSPEWYFLPRLEMALLRNDDLIHPLWKLSMKCRPSWKQIGEDLVRTWPACLIHKWIPLVNYSADTYKLASRLAAGLVHYYNAYTSRQMRVYFWEESREADIAIGNKFDIR